MIDPTPLLSSQNRPDKDDRTVFCGYCRRDQGVQILNIIGITRAILEIALLRANKNSNVEVVNVTQDLTAEQNWSEVTEFGYEYDLLSYSIHLEAHIVAMIGLYMQSSCFVSFAVLSLVFSNLIYLAPIAQEETLGVISCTIWTVFYMYHHVLFVYELEKDTDSSPIAIVLYQPDGYLNEEDTTVYGNSIICREDKTIDLNSIENEVNPEDSGMIICLPDECNDIDIESVNAFVNNPQEQKDFTREESEKPMPKLKSLHLAAPCRRMSSSRHCAKAEHHFNNSKIYTSTPNDRHYSLPMKVRWSDIKVRGATTTISDFRTLNVNSERHYEKPQDSKELVSNLQECPGAFIITDETDANENEDLKECPGSFIINDDIKLSNAELTATGAKEDLQECPGAFIITDDTKSSNAGLTATAAKEDLQDCPGAFIITDDAKSSNAALATSTLKEGEKLNNSILATAVGELGSLFGSQILMEDVEDKGKDYIAGKMNDSGNCCIQVSDSEEEKVSDEDAMLAAAIGEVGWLLGSQMMENYV